MTFLQVYIFTAARLWSHFALPLALLPQPHPMAMVSAFLVSTRKVAVAFPWPPVSTPALALGSPQEPCVSQAHSSAPGPDEAPVPPLGHLPSASTALTSSAHRPNTSRLRALAHAWSETLSRHPYILHLQVSARHLTWGCPAP